MHSLQIFIIEEMTNGVFFMFTTTLINLFTVTYPTNYGIMRLDKPLYLLDLTKYTMTKRQISNKVTSKENSKLIEDEKLSKAEKDLVKEIDKLNQEHFNGVSYIRYGGRD